MHLKEYADIRSTHYNFHLSKYIKGNRTTACKYHPTVFQYLNGSTYEWSVIDNKLENKEIIYFHFQKRKIDKTDVKDLNNYMFVPNRIIPYEDVSVDLICRYSKDKYSYFLSNWVKRIKRAFTSRIK